jgi:AcrR family transcriptional regulator
MALTSSSDPRAKRTRAALQAAFKHLLRGKPYPKISVTDIAHRAGIARHTFYNHYESKQHLLHEIVDEILLGFFEGLEQWDLLQTDQDQELKMQTAFFQSWKENAEIIQLLGTTELELIIIERLKVFFTGFFYNRVSLEFPAIDISLANYVISFNAYSLLGMLKPWFDSALKHDPEHLAGLYIEMAGSRNRRAAVEKFAEIFRDRGITEQS